MAKKTRKEYRKHSGGVRVIAVFVVFAMAFSALGANIVSIVKLLDAFAGIDNTRYYTVGESGSKKRVYYEADLTLYDYYTDNEMKQNKTVEGNDKVFAPNNYVDDDANHGSDHNSYNGKNRNSIFNTALYESGYATRAGSWKHLSYFPLYLGLQFPGQTQGNQMISASGNPYNYSIIANSQAGTGNTSYAVQGLVDEVLVDDQLTQGGGTEVLPYFNSTLLKTPVSKLMNSSTITSKGLDGDETLGEVYTGKKFRFVKYGSGAGDLEGYYGYESTQDILSCASNTFTVGDEGTSVNDLQWDGHASQKGFFPLSLMDLKTTESTKRSFGYGARFDIKFSMSSTGQTVTT